MNEKIFKLQFASPAYMANCTSKKWNIAQICTATLNWKMGANRNFQIDDQMINVWFDVDNKVKGAMSILACF